MPRLSTCASVLAVGCLVLGACADTVSATGLGSVATQVVLEPTEFLVGATCSATPGGVQSYVATLRAFDDSNDTVGVLLPSSLATPCSIPLAMSSFIVAGSSYSAVIEAYDVPANALIPFGGFSSGSSQMLDATGTVVRPRWTSACGGVDASSVVALPNQSNALTGCSPLVETFPSSTELRLGPDELLRAEACVMTDKLTLRLLEGTIALPSELACDAAELKIAGHAGDSFRLYVRAARKDGSEVGCECAGAFVAGQAISPACDAPTSLGNVVLDPGSVVADGVPSCPDGAVYAVSVNGALVGTSRTPCGLKSQVGPLAPGLVDIAIARYDAKGEPLAGTLACKADVEPGRVVPASCL